MFRTTNDLPYKHTHVNTEAQNARAAENSGRFGILSGRASKHDAARIVRQTGLPPEVLVDLALELLDIASRKLSPSPIQRQAVGLGAARWRNVSAEERSKVLRRAAQARWAKVKRTAKNDKP